MFNRMSLKNLTQDIKKCAEEIKIKKKKKNFLIFSNLKISLYLYNFAGGWARTLRFLGVSKQPQCTVVVAS